LYDEIKSFQYNEGEELLRWGMETPEFADNCWGWGSYDYPADAKEVVEILYLTYVKMLEEEAAREAPCDARIA